MSNELKDISIKNRTYCFFNDPNKTKLDENSYKNVLI